MDSYPIIENDDEHNDFYMENQLSVLTTMKKIGDDNDEIVNKSNKMDEVKKTYVDEEAGDEDGSENDIDEDDMEMDEDVTNEDNDLLSIEPENYENEVEEIIENIEQDEDKIDFISTIDKYFGALSEVGEAEGASGVNNYEDDALFKLNYLFSDEALTLFFTAKKKKKNSKTEENEQNIDHSWIDFIDDLDTTTKTDKRINFALKKALEIESHIDISNLFTEFNGKKLVNTNQNDFVNYFYGYTPYRQILALTDGLRYDKNNLDETKFTIFQKKIGKNAF